MRQVPPSIFNVSFKGPGIVMSYFKLQITQQFGKFAAKVNFRIGFLTL